jgi:protein O-mannosyl-transferase
MVKSDRKQTARHRAKTADAAGYGYDRKVWLPVGLLFVLTVVTYFPVLSHDFTNWDDPDNIFYNPIVAQPSWSGVLKAWSGPVNNIYAPLVWMSFMADALIGSGSARSFHVTNLILHLVSVVAVFFALRRLVRSEVFAVSAALGAALFAIHPVQVEAVAWATGRKDVLAGSLLLSAIAMHLHVDLF